MLSRTADQITQSPWARLVWSGIAVLALIQVVAFYRLCTSQVERAQVRETAFVQQRNALTDCLDYMHNSTISSCARHARSADTGSLAARDLPRAQLANHKVLSSAVPVSYVFH